MNGDMQRGDYRGRGNARGQMGGPPGKINTGLCLLGLRQH
jgi:hypothetical protein